MPFLPHNRLRQSTEGQSTEGRVCRNILVGDITVVLPVGAVVRALYLRLAGSTAGLALSDNNSGQVAHTHVPLLPSSIIWYRSGGGDALQLGR